MDIAGRALETFLQRRFAADRFHDQLLGRLVALRYKRLAPVHLLLLFPLKSDPPLLALAMSSDENAMHALLRDLKFTLPCWLPLLHVLLCLAVLASAYWSLPAGMSYDQWLALQSWQWLLPAVCAAGAVALTAWFALRLRAVRSEIRCGLGQSDIMRLLADQDDRLWSILDHVPQLFHTPFMLVRRGSPQGALDLVGSNLDWYLDAPRTLLRPNWIAELLLPALALEFALYPAAHSGLAAAVLDPVWQLLGLGIAVGLVLIAYAARRREVFLEELIRELRGRFEQ